MKAKIGGYNLRIRKATWQDYQFCHRLAKRNMSSYVKKYWGGWNSKLYRQNFNPKNTMIVLYKNKRIAFFRIKPEPDCLYLEDMQISGSMRKKGIGTGLMRIIEKKTIQNKTRKIRLTVFKDNPAKKLYERLAFKIKEDKGNSVLMEKISIDTSV